jgi:cyclopropane-fatty-acyl-phospholipid synthase
MEQIGQSYAVTLREWRRRFHASIERVRELGYDGRFERIWEFYLASCEACFVTGWLDDAQLLYGRDGEGRA